MIRTSLFLLLATGLALTNHHRSRSEWKAWAKEINGVANRTWTARVAKEINFEDEGVLRSMIGASLSPNANLSNVKDFKPRSRLLQAYPESYDLRAAYPLCESLTFIRNQFSCGACWAFSTMNSLTDRTCIKTYGQRIRVQRSWSMQDVLESCDQATCGVAPTQGCNGGFLDGAFNYALKTGVCTGEQADDTKGCKPFFLSKFDFSLPASPLPRFFCTNLAFTGTYFTDRMKIRGIKSYSNQFMKTPDLILAIQDALMKRGTLVAFLRVYEDIYLYSSGIYMTNGVNMLGAHAVRLIGWGSENGVNYWLLANSWGQWWGEKGYFRIVRGVNNSGIEEYIIEGVI